MAPPARAEAIPDRKSGSAGMPRPISYAVFCLKKKSSGIGRELQKRAEESKAAEQDSSVHATSSSRLVADLVIVPTAAGSLSPRHHFFFFFNNTPPTEIYTLSLHDALPIWLFDRLQTI